MRRDEIRIAGFGGQGIILAGRVLGRAASIYDGKFATQLQSYGPEARGSACSTEVVISDTPIDCPMVTGATLFAAMSQEGLDRYIDGTKSGGTVVIDPGLVTRVPDERKFRVYSVPVGEVASKEFKPLVANMVMIGALARISGVISKDALIEAVKTSVPQGTEALNIQAVERGFELGGQSLEA